MNKQRKVLNSRVLFSLLLLIIGASLLFNVFVSNHNSEKFKNKEVKLHKIKASQTDKIYTGKIDRINQSDDNKFSSFFLVDVEGNESSMFNQGVTIYADNLKISGKKTSFDELAVGDEIELITIEHAPVTMMIPPSIAGNAVVGINVI